MRKINLMFVIFLWCMAMASISHANSQATKESVRNLEVGSMFHITGCENGVLLVSQVKLWDRPATLLEGAKPIGMLGGDSIDHCQGAIVKLLGKTTHSSGRLFLNIKSIVNGTEGWITDSFVGKIINESECKEYFKDTEFVDNCDYIG